MKKQKLIRNLIISGAVILTLLFLFIFLLYKRKRDAVQKQKEATLNMQVLEKEMKALRSQIKPHFIFHALTSIQEFVASNKVGLADEYISEFTLLMRLVLTNSKNTEVELFEELKVLELYMQLEQKRLKYPFSYKINIDENVETKNFMVPPLILQPIVENAILHGLKPKNEPGKILINLKLLANSLVVIVQDNGVGRKATESSTNKSGDGLELTRERLKLLNSELIITDLFTNNGLPAGTKVEFALPLLS